MKKYFLIVGILWATLTQATTYTVTSLADAGAGSLREAIGLATTDGDIINISVAGTITLASNLPQIDYAITINGAADGTTISGNSLYSIFTLYPNTGTVTLNKLTLKNGYSGIGISPAVHCYSATSGSVVLNNCTIIDCVNENSTGDSYGGAVSTYINIDINNCTISGNSAQMGGGALATYDDVDVNINACTIINNHSETDGGGGGLNVYGNIGNGNFTITNTILANNTEGASNTVADVKEEGASLTSNGYNISTTAPFGEATDLINQTYADLKLNALEQINGQWVYPTRDGSIVIDRGSSNTAPTLDQAGRNRLNAADIGAFEYGPTTWDGSAWDNGTPTTSVSAIIDGNYTANNNLSMADLTVNAGKDLNIASGVSVTVNGNFLIQSDVSGIGSFINDGTLNLSGSASMELQLAAAQRYYYVSSPIPNASSLAFGGSIELSGGSTTARKLYKFDGSAWQRIMTGGEIFAAGNGYAFKPETTNSKWTLTGSSYNNGSVSASTLNFNGSNFQGSADDYTLFGNPYPSAIDLDAMSSTDCGDDFYHRADGNFVTYNVAGGVQTPIEATAGFNARYVQSMQAVWVEATSASASLSVDNLARVHNSQSVHKNNALLNGLYLGINTADQTLVAFNSEAGNGYDRYDSRKMIFDGASQIYTIGANNLAINTFTGIDKNMSIPVGVKISTNGAQQINVLFGDGFDASVSVYLEDKLTGAMHNLRSGAYSFDATEGTISDRFVLHLTQGTTGVKNTNTSDVNVYAYDKMAYISSNVAGKAQIFDVAGREVATKTLSGASTLTGLHIAQTGVYVVKVSTANGITTHKIVIE